MYPYDIIPGFDLYSLFFLFALLSSLIVFRIIGDKVKLNVKVYNLSIITGIAAIICGYFASILVQATYDYIETGVFRLDSTVGMTFYGGFIGGAVTFIAIYFGMGAFVCREKEHLHDFRLVSDIASCSIVCAHATGRIGCMFAGCCHGIETDAWYGIMNVHLGHKTVPTQPMESVFLYALLVLLVYRVLHGKTYNLAIYLMSYGVFRFGIEYLRADDRGASPIPFLTPSQFVAVILIVTGAAVITVMKLTGKRKIPTADDDEAEE